MKDLFGNDNALKMRDAKGRYATPIRSYADKAKKDAEYWKYMADKYRRMYESVVWMVAFKDRIINKMKGK